jgi:hypothetical protein
MKMKELFDYRFVRMLKKQDGNHYRLQIVCAPYYRPFGRPENGRVQRGYYDGKSFNKPYPWPLADTGALDILGNPTGEIFLAQAAWGLLKNPMIVVQPVNHPGVNPAKMVWRGTNAIPFWSWKNCEGNKAVVVVYANAYTVELLLNGERVGKKRVKDCIAKFKTKYTSGKLAVVSFDKYGNECGRSELQSALGKISIRIRPEEDCISVGDIAYINIDLCDENGEVECNADTKLKISVEGGTLLAFGSTNPRTLEYYTNGNFTTYYGKAQAVIRADKAGTIRITASGNDMGRAFAEIKTVDKNMT